MPQDATADPTDRLDNSSADNIVQNATLTLLVVCFVSFWLITAFVVL